MRKNTFANLIAFIIGVYFMVRAYFFYTSKTGDAEQNTYYALIYFCVGVLAIIIQLVVNYLKKKKEK